MEAVETHPFVWQYGVRQGIRTVEWWLVPGRRCHEAEPWREWGCPVAWFDECWRQDFVQRLSEYAHSSQYQGTRMFTPYVPNHLRDYHPVLFDDAGWCVDEELASWGRTLSLGQYIERELKLAQRMNPHPALVVI